MGFKCFVPMCQSGYKSNKNKVSLFKVSIDMLDKWRCVIPRQDRKLTLKDHVCEKHFLEHEIIREEKTECYTITYKNPKLAKGAVPSQFPGCPAYLSKNVKIRRQLSRSSANLPKCKNQKVDSIPCEIPSDVLDSGVNTFENLYNQLWEGGPQTLTLPSKSWAMHLIQNETTGRIISFSEMEATAHNSILKKKVLYSKNFLRFYIYDNLVTENIVPISSTEDIQNILNNFNNELVCSGAAEICEVSVNLKSTAYKQDKVLNVWRHANCEYKLPKNQCSNKCAFCKKAGYSIQKLKKRLPKLAISKEMAKIMKKKHTDLHRKQQIRLKKKNTRLQDELANCKKQIKELNEEDVFSKIEQHELASSQKLLIKECLQCCKYNRKSSRRYTSEWLLLCLLLHIKSPATYQFLRSNDILPLPCISTVRKYLSRVNLKCGLDEEFFSALKLKMNEKKDFQKHGILIFDEVQVRPSVTLDVKTMKLMGIQDFGKSNKFTSKTSDKKADHALVFMYSSLSENYSQPVAVYAAKGATNGTCLAQLILEIIKKLEQSDAVIHGIVCDGATTNKKMWKECGISGKINNPVFKIVHPITENRFLYFFSDAPHLIKCIRNILYQKSILHPPEGQISWGYYKHLFNLDNELPNNLRVCPKLTSSHIHPSNFLKMKVKLATQIFSNSTADGLKYYKSLSQFLQGSDATIQFTKRINDLFDTLNRRFPAEGIRKGNKDFQVMQESLEWLNTWENMMLDGKIGKDEFLSQNTSEGLRVTLLSTKELTEELLTKHGFLYVLTNKMNQDPLERFFGIIRQSGRDNDHPTFTTFLQLYRMLSVYKLLKPPKFGNCIVQEDVSDETLHLTFSNFLSSFKEKSNNKTEHLMKIKNKLSQLLESDITESELLLEKTIEVLEEDKNFLGDTSDCVIYYLAGFICKKLYKESQCGCCKQHLYHKTPQMYSSSSLLTDIKSKGYLNHPNILIYNFLKNTEIIIMKNIHSVEVFEETLNDLSEENFIKKFTFPCQSHRDDIFIKIIFNYMTMRISQFYRQEDKKKERLSAMKKKEAKLQKA